MRCLRLAAWGLGLATMMACVRERPPLPRQIGSFRVELVAIDPFAPPSDCAGTPSTGTAACPRPFAEATAPVAVTVRATALDQGGLPQLDWSGAAFVDVRPGALAEVGPEGRLVTFQGGVAELQVRVIHAVGATRVWVEDCGAGGAPATFATGVSPELWFDRPRLDQVNATSDNGTSPLIPRANNICVIGGDPRFGVGTDDDGAAALVGHSQGGTINAPPPAIGTFVEVVGCPRSQQAQGSGCGRGPLVVTGVTNEGFFVTDLHPEATARGFNHVYVFNFNYPGDLVQGDVLLSLRGSPVEFGGATQLSNPSWVRDAAPREPDLTPAPIRLEPEVYATSLRSFGRNQQSELALEKLEGALVCVDNLAPASQLHSCDVNQSGGIERHGCLLPDGVGLPPRCGEGMSDAPTAPGCDAASMRPTCLPLGSEELAACELLGNVPANPQEYCCERRCYNDFACADGSAYASYGQWVADVHGRYEAVGSDKPLKIGIVTRDADPDFDPFAFARGELARPAEQRRHLRVVGNLRQVLAARPVWVVVARSAADIRIDEACP